MAEPLKVQTPDGIREIAVETIPDGSESSETVDQRMRIVAGYGMVDQNNPLPVKTASQSVNGASTYRAMTETFATEIVSMDPDRISFMIYNEGPGIMYVRFGADASSNDFTFKLNPGDYYESATPVYTGQVTTVASESGHAQITSMKNQ